MGQDGDLGNEQLPPMNNNATTATSATASTTTTPSGSQHLVPCSSNTSANGSASGLNNHCPVVPPPPLLDPPSLISTTTAAALATATGVCVGVGGGGGLTNLVLSGRVGHYTLPHISSGGNGPVSSGGDHSSYLTLGGGGRPQHYFRPIHGQHPGPGGGPPVGYLGPPGGLHHRPPYLGRLHDDIDLTSDSDAISSPTSSTIGPPPVHGVGRPSSPHHLTPLLPVCYNGTSPGVPLPPGNPSNPSVLMPGYHHTIYSPTGGGGGPCRFDESSFLGTSDACSSPETGSLPRTAKLTKRKRPPRPPPRRLKTDDPYLAEEDGPMEDDPHLRHYLATGRCIDYGSWPRDSPSPAEQGYHQQQMSMLSMSMGGRMDELQDQDDKLEAAMALSEIRTQLQELTKSVESCQTEVTEVKRDMISMRNDIDMVHHVKEELDDLRECVDRIDEQSRRRKTRLLEQGLTVFLCFAIFAAVLGMLQFGYNTGVINAPHQEIEDFIFECYESRGEGKRDAETERTVKIIHSFVVSFFAIGGMLGGFSGGIIANRFGRKGGLLLNNLIGICGGSLMGAAKSIKAYELLILGRFVIGVNCGLNTSLVPMYVSEIAPLNLRGALGTVNQLAVTVGLLVSQVLGIEQLLGTEEGWPVLLGLAVVPAILQMLLLPLCPESPRYLFITKQREDDARRALRKFRASNHVEEDIEEMRAEVRAQQAESTISMLQLLRSSKLRMPLVIAVVMQLSQQLSGINAVFYYSTKLFGSAGLKEAHAKFATIGVGAIMVGMTLVSIMLMDRAGRRTLHLYGVGGMFIFSIFITISFLIKEILDWISYLAVIFTLCFVVFFAVGPGSIPWLITAELFSQGPRPAAMSIAVLTNWLANWFVGNFFPQMSLYLTSYVFLPFSVLLAIFWIFTYKLVPETKNKTFEEIAALFQGSGMARAPSDDSHIYGMLNCVNHLGQAPPPDSAAPLIQEKQPLESSASGRSSRGEMSPPGNVPPPPVPFSIPPYPHHRFLDDNAV